MGWYLGRVTALPRVCLALRGWRLCCALTCRARELIWYTCVWSLCMFSSLSHTHSHTYAHITDSCRCMNVCGDIDLMLNGNLPQLFSTLLKYLSTIFICLFNVRVHMCARCVSCVWACLPVHAVVKGRRLSCSVTLYLVLSLNLEPASQPAMVFSPLS